MCFTSQRRYNREVDVEEQEVASMTEVINCSQCTISTIIYLSQMNNVLISHVGTCVQMPRSPAVRHQ